MVNPRDAVAEGLAITWLHHRGPGTVKFDPTVPPIANGTAVTTARFSEPGIYVLRAVADDYGRRDSERCIPLDKKP